MAYVLRYLSNVDYMMYSLMLDVFIDVDYITCIHTGVDHWIFILNYCDTESQKAQTGQDMDCSRLEQQ